MSCESDLGGPGIILNLAGEGELAFAIDINSLVLTLRDPRLWIRAGRFIRADITAIPVRSDVAAEVVGRKLPIMTHEERLAVAREAVRVAVPGGVIRLHASSGDGTLWLPFLEAALTASATLEGIYAVGVKPR